MGYKPISVESSTRPQVLVLVPIMWLRRVHINFIDFERALLVGAFLHIGLN